MNPEALTLQEAIFAYIRKVRKQIIIAIIAIAVILFLCLYLFKPAVKVDLTQLKVLEQNQIALTQQNEALKSLVSKQHSTIELLMNKDSTILTKLDLNKLAIEKLKPYESHIDYSNYDSTELVRSYANLR